MKHGVAQTNGIELHYVEEGSGPLMILLHGFPEFWHSWRKQIPVLSRKYHVVAPDMRGYNDSDKPEGVDAYAMPNLIGDLKGLIEHFGKKKAVLVAHDWGGLVAWTFAGVFPDSVERLICLNIPHPDTFGMLTLNERIVQLSMSWYIFFFQKLDLPEKFIMKDNFAFFDRIFSEAFSPKEIEEYKKAFAKPRALTSAINYYRANLKPEMLVGEAGINLGKVKVPTLLIWGERDMALSLPLARYTKQCVEGPYKAIFLPDHGHWIQNEAPDEVNKAILEFLG